MWQKNIAYSLHFLSVPIAIQKASLEEQEIYTNLWRIFKVILQRVYMQSKNAYGENEQLQEGILKILETAEQRLFVEEMQHELAEIPLDQILLSQNDDAQSLEFKTPNNEARIRIIRNAVLPNRPRQQNQQQQFMRENIASDDIDVGNHVLHKHHIELIQEQCEGREIQFDRLGLLVERHEILDELMEDEKQLRLVSKEIFITEQCDLTEYMHMRRTTQTRKCAEYRDMLNALCKIYLFFVHSGPRGVVIMRECMRMFHSSMPNSKPQQIFKAAETIYQDNTILGNGMPSKNTNEGVRKIIATFLQYVEKDSKMTLDDFEKEMREKTTKAFWKKLCEIKQISEFKN